MSEEAKAVHGGAAALHGMLEHQHEERALGPGWPEPDGFLAGYVFAFWQLGLLNDMEYEGWVARIEWCPGAVGGGQVWCAYCGDVEETDTGHRPVKAVPE